VPDFSGSKGRSESWLVEGSLYQVLQAVSELAGSWNGGRLEQASDTEITLILGSRFAYRMLGFLTPSRRMPLTVELSVAQEEEGIVQLTAKAASDEGWGLIDIESWAIRLYNRVFSELFAALRRLAPPCGPADLGTPG
jgi:hypothetical protein